MALTSVDTISVPKQLESRVIIAPGELQNVAARVAPDVKKLGDLLNSIERAEKASDAARNMMKKSEIPEIPTDHRELEIVKQMEANLLEASKLAPTDERRPELAITFGQLHKSLADFYGGDWGKAAARSTQVKAKIAKEQLSLEFAHALNSLYDAATKVGPSMS